MDQPDMAQLSRWSLEAVDYITMRFIAVASATHASMTGSWATDIRSLDLMAYDSILVSRYKAFLEKLPAPRRVGDTLPHLLAELAEVVEVVGVMLLSFRECRIYTLGLWDQLPLTKVKFTFVSRLSLGYRLFADGMRPI